MTSLNSLPANLLISMDMHTLLELNETASTRNTSNPSVPAHHSPLKCTFNPGIKMARDLEDLKDNLTEVPAGLDYRLSHLIWHTSWDGHLQL
jgi:hypothetical protein